MKIKVHVKEIHYTEVIIETDDLGYDSILEKVEEEIAETDVFNTEYSHTASPEEWSFWEVDENENITREVKIQ